MNYIVPIAVVAILLFQSVASIPLTGVGGSVVVGLLLLAAAPVVGVYEAWTKRRGALGWVVNILVSFVGALLLAPLGGMVLALLLTPLSGGRTLAAEGGPALSLALAGMMVVVLMSAWAAIWVVNRWR